MHMEEMELQVNTSTETESVRKTRERVITVGDVKTTMTVTGVRNRSPDEFECSVLPKSWDRVDFIMLQDKF